MAETSSQVKFFSREEVKKHSDANKACIVIHNSVYDVTKFLAEHPGGEEVLLERAGQESSEQFEDVGHSSDARAMMTKYKIGEIIAEDRIETKEKNPVWNDSETENSNSSFNSWILPLVLGIFATIVYRYLFA